MKKQNQFRHNYISCHILKTLKTGIERNNSARIKEVSQIMITTGARLSEAINIVESNSKANKQN